MSLISALVALHITFTHLTPISSANCIPHTPDLGPTALSSLLNNLCTTSSSRPTNLCLFVTLYGNIFSWISLLYIRLLLYMKLTHYIASSYWRRLFCTSQKSENQKCEWENPRTTAHEISWSTLQKHLFKQFKKDILKSNLQTASLQHQKWRLTQKCREMKWKVVVLVFIHFQIKP